MLGVVKLVPEAVIPPPVKATYQFTVPELAVAPSTTVPASQRAPGVVAVIVGVGVTVAVTAVRLAVVQLLLVAST